MPHIHTQPGQHDLTASAFIFRTDYDEPKLLLHFHIKLHKLMQFGGHVELHETPWQTLKHEILEESGYAIQELKLLQPYIGSPELVKPAVVHPQPMVVATYKYGNEDHYHTDLAYGFTVTHAPASKVAAGESETLELYSASEIAALTDTEISPNTRQVALYVFKNYLPTWDLTTPSDFE